MDGRDGKDLLTVALAQAEVVAHAEEHHGADRLSQERSGIRNYASHSHLLHHSIGAGDIQNQAQQTHDHQRGSEDVLHNATKAQLFLSGSSQNRDGGNGHEGLSQIQNAHTVGFCRTKQGNKQGDTQHTRFLGSKQLGQVMVGEALSAPTEGPQAAGEQSHQHQHHGTQGFRRKRSRQAGIKQHTGQAKLYYKLLQGLNVLLGEHFPLPGQYTQEHAGEDRGNDLQNGQNLVNCHSSLKRIKLPYSWWRSPSGTWP